jgi:uncharacterized membrane protein YoaK (UPF0700 family)
LGNLFLPLFSMTNNTMSQRQSFFLAGVTAFTAGMTNIAGVMACFNYTSNLTGHATSVASHMVSGNYFEMVMVLGWLLMFVLGAGIAHFLIRSFESNNLFLAHASPIFLEFCLLVGIGVYGSMSRDHSEQEIIVFTFVLLLSMGIQNGAVNTISDGKIKTSHLTGLFTDLGSELSEWIHPKTGRPAALATKIQLRLSILFFYLFGAAAAGWLYTQISFYTFFVIAATLCLMIVQDLRNARLSSRPR